MQGSIFIFRLFFMKGQNGDQMITTYIFDLDGTLTDTMESIAYFCNLSLNWCGLPSLKTKDFQYMVGDGRDVLIHKMLARFNRDDEETFRRAAEKYDAEYKRDFMHLVKKYDGMEETLHILKDRGKRLCVLSNKPHDMTQAIVGTVFPGVFDMVYGHRQGIAHKPDPEAVRLLLDEIVETPENCIFIGDTNVDIFTGKNAGIQTVGVLWGFRDARELEAAGADYIISHPSELLRL